jgi:hypothetical protein
MREGEGGGGVLVVGLGEQCPTERCVHTYTTMYRMPVHRLGGGSPTTRNEEGDGSAPWIFVAHFLPRVDDGQVATLPCLHLKSQPIPLAWYRCSVTCGAMLRGRELSVVGANHVCSVGLCVRQ